MVFFTGCLKKQFCILLRLRVGNLQQNRKVSIMNQEIQPKYYQAKVTCNCGNTFTTGSTKEEIRVEVCSKCHPFYTGMQKATRADGRIDKFNKKYGMKEA